MPYTQFTDGSVFDIDDFPSVLYPEVEISPDNYENQVNNGLYYHIDSVYGENADKDITESVKSLKWIYKLSLISMSAPEDTLYRYKVFVKNLTTGVIQPDTAILQFIAKANTVSDLVDSVITTNKLAEGAITADKLAAGTITADKIAAQDLLAKGATVGMLSAEGVKVEDAGFWASKEFDYEYTDPKTLTKKTYRTAPGEFFVGNDPSSVPTQDEFKIVYSVDGKNFFEDFDMTIEAALPSGVTPVTTGNLHEYKYIINDDNAQYIHYYPKEHSNRSLADSFAIKIRNFIIKSIGSFLSGVFSVKSKVSDKDRDAFFVVNPGTKESLSDYDFDIGDKEVRIGSSSEKDATLTVNGTTRLNGDVEFGKGIEVPSLNVKSEDSNIEIKNGNINGVKNVSTNNVETTDLEVSGKVKDSLSIEKNLTVSGDTNTDSLTVNTAIFNENVNAKKGMFVTEDVSAKNVNATKSISAENINATEEISATNMIVRNQIKTVKASVQNLTAINLNASNAIIPVLKTNYAYVDYIKQAYSTKIVVEGKSVFFSNPFYDKAFFSNNGILWIGIPDGITLRPSVLRLYASAKERANTIILPNSDYSPMSSHPGHQLLVSSAGAVRWEETDYIPIYFTDNNNDSYIQPVYAEVLLLYIDTAFSGGGVIS